MNRTRSGHAEILAWKLKDEPEGQTRFALTDIGVAISASETACEIRVLSWPDITV